MKGTLGGVRLQCGVVRGAMWLLSYLEHQLSHNSGLRSVNLPDFCCWPAGAATRVCGCGGWWRGPRSTGKGRGKDGEARLGVRGLARAAAAVGPGRGAGKGQCEGRDTYSAGVVLPFKTRARVASVLPLRLLQDRWSRIACWASSTISTVHWHLADGVQQGRYHQGSTVCKLAGRLVLGHMLYSFFSCGKVGAISRRLHANRVPDYIFFPRALSAGSIQCRRSGITQPRPCPTRPTRHRGITHHPSRPKACRAHQAYRRQLKHTRPTPLSPQGRLSDSPLPKETGRDRPAGVQKGTPSVANCPL